MEPVAVIGLAQLRSAAADTHYAQWSGAIATTGMECIFLEGAREIYIDPDGTTAGSLLKIREAEGMVARYARPGDVLRFGTARRSFWVQNALARVATQVSRGHVYVSSPDDFPAGYLRILASTQPGALIPTVQDRRTSTPMATRPPHGVANNNSQRLFYPIADAGDGERDIIALGVGLKAFRIAAIPIAAGKPIEVPADFAVVARLSPLMTKLGNPNIPAPNGAFAASPWTETDPYQALVPPWVDAFSPRALTTYPDDAGVIAPPAGEADLEFTEAIQVVDREAPAGSIVTFIELISAVATGATHILFACEGY